MVHFPSQVLGVLLGVSISTPGADGDMPQAPPPPPPPPKEPEPVVPEVEMTGALRMSASCDIQCHQ